MFRYENNNKLSKPGETQNKVVFIGRPVTYINRFRKDHKTVEKVSQGWEIVEEHVISPDFSIPVKVELLGDPKTVLVNHKAKVEKKEDDETRS